MSGLRDPGGRGWVSVIAECQVPVDSTACRAASVRRDMTPRSAYDECFGFVGY